MASGGRGIAVVVPARDAQASLGRAVRSALGEPLVTECVVVDDASADRTASVAEGLASADPRVAIVRRSVRGGPAAARNAGLDAARADWVCFLDADDELVAGGLSALGDALAATPGAVCALGRFVAHTDAGEQADVGPWSHEQLSPVVRRGGRTIESPEGMTPEALVTRLVSPPPGAWLVDVEALRAVGGFDEGARRSEDVELLVRLAFSGRIVCVQRDCLYYARHGAQRSQSHTARRWGRSLTLWLMLRSAPGARATLRLARGMRAYHLELFERRASSPRPEVRVLRWRNLAAIAALWAAGSLAAVLPRRALRPRPKRTVD